jgi:hypothetical protein
MTLTYEEFIAVERFLSGREPSDWTKGRIKGRIEGYDWGKIDTMKDVILSIRFSPALAAKARRLSCPCKTMKISSGFIDNCSGQIMKN